MEFGRNDHRTTGDICCSTLVAMAEGSGEENNGYSSFFTAIFRN